MEQKEKILTKDWVVALTAILCCLLWGSAFPCIKIGYGLFHIASEDTASQILFAGIRFALAGVLTIVIGSLTSGKALIPSGTTWTRILKLCLFQTVLQYLFFYVGLAHTTGVKASIIEASNVFFAILASCLIFRLEKLGKEKIFGCILGFSGVVLINLNGSGLEGGMSILGEGFILFSTLSYAFSSTMVKRYAQKDTPVLLSGYQFLLGGIIMVCTGAGLGGHLEGFSLPSTILLFYMAVISAVAYSMWAVLLKYNPVGKVAVYGFMNPVFGVILSAALLEEKNQAFTLQGLASLALVCGGIYVVNNESSVKKCK